MWMCNTSEIQNQFIFISIYHVLKSFIVLGDEETSQLLVSFREERKKNKPHIIDDEFGHLI